MSKYKESEQTSFEIGAERSSKSKFTLFGAKIQFVMNEAYSVVLTLLC